MRCLRCGDVQMVDWIATEKQPYKYTLSGLKNVILSGIHVYNCPECDTQLPVIPKIEELHDLLAREIASKHGPLKGDEIKFLRKNAGFPANKFAVLLGVDPSHLSRVENGHHTSLGDSADRLARAIAMIAKDGDAAREILLQIANNIDGDVPPKKPGKKAPCLPHFKLERQRWLRVA